MQNILFDWYLGAVEPEPIVITMSEPRIQIVQIGQTVKFDCNARPAANVQGKF